MSDKSSWPEQSFGFGAFYFSYYSFVGVFPTYVTLYLAFRGIDAFEIGILMSLMQAMRIIGPNLWGWMADRTGQRARVLQFTAASALIAFTGFFFRRRFLVFRPFHGRRQFVHQRTGTAVGCSDSFGNAGQHVSVRAAAIVGICRLCSHDGRFRIGP